jgi:hypothetical protein
MFGKHVQQWQIQSNPKLAYYKSKNQKENNKPIAKLLVVDIIRKNPKDCGKMKCDSDSDKTNKR